MEGQVGGLGWGKSGLKYLEGFVVCDLWARGG